MPWLQVPVTDISHRTPGTCLIINSRCPLFSARCRGLAWFSDPWRSYKLFRCDLPVLSIARKNEKHMFYLCWFGAVSPLETSLAYLSQCVLWCASFRNRSKNADVQDFNSIKSSVQDKHDPTPPGLLAVYLEFSPTKSNDNYIYIYYYYYEELGR